MPRANSSKAAEIIPSEIRRSGITSHSIGIPELARLIDAVPPEAKHGEYRRAVLEDNVLGLATDNGRLWRYKTLRRTYYLRPDSLLFRALRDLWPHDPDAQPLLAALCALATDTVFRTSAAIITAANPGEEVAVGAFAEAIDQAYPGAYASSTLRKAASNAYTSWQQSGHLTAAEAGAKLRQRATCRATDVAYALFLGHLTGQRGETLFDTIWARILDQPRSSLHDLAFAASQRGMLEYRGAGGVVEIGFRELLRPFGSELF